jgi:MFS family permease
VRRLLLLVSGVVLTETVFFTALAPLLPHYSRTLDLSKFEVGLLVGSYAAGSFIGALPAGMLAARAGVKATMLGGLGLLGGLSVVFAFADSIWVLDFARLGQGVGAAMSWTGALAWLVTEAPRERRGELIGIATAAAASGALLGPAVGAAASVVGTRPAFGAVAVLALALGACCLLVSGPQRGATQPLRSLLPAIRRPGTATGLWLMALPSLAFGVLDVLAPLRLGHLGLAGPAIGAIFLGGAALQAAASVVVGRWGDRSGRRAPLRASLIAAAAVSLAIPFATNVASLAFLLIIAATAYGAFYAPAMALLADEAEGAGLDQALGLALLNVAWSPGQLVGATGSGALANTVGDAVPYFIVALLSMLTLAGLQALNGSPTTAEAASPSRGLVREKSDNARRR